MQSQKNSSMASTPNLASPISSLFSVQYQLLLQNYKNINELKFPGREEVFEFKKEDFIEADIIDSSRHVVKRYSFNPLNFPLAVKSVNIPMSKHQKNDNRLERLIKEVQNFSTLSYSPYVVDFYGICLHEGEALICMELMDWSLDDLYKNVHESSPNAKIKFPEDVAGVIASRILNALSFCKKKEIMHRDVKPKNVLLKKNGEVKLCDFGESRILQDSLASSSVGTIGYWPPERFTTLNADHHYDIRSDIWSLGITLGEIVSGSLPYANGHDRKKLENFIYMQRIIQNIDSKKLIEQCFANYSPDLRDFVEMCLERLDKRPKYDQLMNTPFYQFYAKNDDEKNEANDEILSSFMHPYFLATTFTVNDASQTKSDETISDNTLKESEENLSDEA